MTSEAGPITVYGATGYTGRLVAAELASRDVPFVVAGRNREKLEALSGTFDPGVAPEIRAVSNCVPIRLPWHRRDCSSSKSVAR